MDGLAFHLKSLADSDLALAQALINQGKASDALAVRAVLADRYPGSAALALIDGLIALGKGNGAGALRHLGAAYHQVPGHPLVGFPLAQVLNALGQTAQAQTALAEVREAVRGGTLDLSPAYQAVAGQAMAFYGRMLLQAQDLPGAEDAARLATEMAPQAASGWTLWGVALRRLGQYRQAEHAFLTSLERTPRAGQAGIHMNLADMAASRGQWSQALHHCQQAFATQDGGSQGANLGSLLLAISAARECDQLDTAWAFCAQAEALAPSDPGVWNAKGLLLTHEQKHQEALDCYRHAIAALPQDASLYANAASAAALLKDWTLAAAYEDEALERNPSEAAALNARGQRLIRQGDYTAARDVYQTLLAAHPNDPAGISNLSYLFRRAGLLQEALDLALGAIDRGIWTSAIAACAATALLNQRKIHAAMQMFIAALDDPHGRWAEHHSNLCMTSHYDADCSLEERAWLSEHFGQRLAAEAAAKGVCQHRPQPLQGRPLRVGYLSGDLRTHSVAYFLAPVLEAHDRRRVEPYLYSTVSDQDSMTDRLRAAAQGYRPLWYADDDAALAQIQADGIDVLVDLSGHTAHNRLPLIGRRPAPVLLTWLGYPGVTGVRAFDGRIVDGWTDPVHGNPEQDILGDRAEPLIRLPRCFLAYDRPQSAPAPAPLPALSHPVFTFGSFNTAHKINGPVIDCWAAILRGAENSRLVLKAKQYGDAPARDALLAAFEDRGVAPGRVQAMGYAKSFAEHLAFYAQVDMALDTFPYNGTTTTCEALWMGVPTLTLAGDHHAARVGLSLMTAVGLADRFCASSRDDYVARATAFAANPAPLAALRDGMRARLDQSPLGDARGLAACLEDTMEQLYAAKCQGGAP